MNIMKMWSPLKATSANCVIVLLILLFVYTSTSKFLDYNRFVFQMRLAPAPFMVGLAPTLGWFIPVIEIFIAIALAAGFFYPRSQKLGLVASIILLAVFEIYITIMLLSGSRLPCTCGGLVSQMGWRQHLIFNALFIIGGIIALRYKKEENAARELYASNCDRILSRA